MKEHDVVYVLFKNPVSVSDHTVLNDMVAAYCKLFTQEFTCRYCEKPRDTQTGYLVSRPKYERGTSRIQLRRSNT